MTISKTRNYVLFVILGILAVALVTTGFVSANEEPADPTPNVTESDLESSQAEDDATVADKAEAFEWTEEQLQAVREGREDEIIDEICLQYDENGKCVAIPGIPAQPATIVEDELVHYDVSEMEFTFRQDGDFTWTDELLDAAYNGRLDEIMDEVCLQYDENGDCIGLRLIPAFRAPLTQTESAQSGVIQSGANGNDDVSEGPVPGVPLQPRISLETP